MTEILKLSSIRIDGGTQLRAETNEETVASYAADMLAGDVFPPVVVYHDGIYTWLSDGFHRYLAAQQTGKDEIDADVRQGTLRDALLYAAEANRKHGLPLNNKDKRRVAELFLSDTEWTQWSDREIARRTGLSNRFVSTVRQELSVNGSQMERKVERNGTVYTQNTANIGASRLDGDQQADIPVWSMVEVGKSLLRAKVLFDESPSGEMDFDDPRLQKYSEEIKVHVRTMAQSVLAVGRMHNRLMKRHGYTLEQVFSEAWNEFHMYPDHLSQLMLYAEQYGEMPIEQVPQKTLGAICEVATEHIFRRDEDIKQAQAMNRSNPE